MSSSAIVIMPIKEGKPRDSLIKYQPEQEVAEDLTLKKKKLQLSPLDPKLTTEEILNAIITPLQWKEGTKIYARTVSVQPSSREEASSLKKQLDERIAARQARESGICAIREELNYQCFDQIIRQVTIDCPERGLLLVRVRDELKMTIAAYQTLFDSSVTFGMRKQMQSELGTPQLQVEIKELNERKAILKDKLSQLGKKRQFIQKQIKERRGSEQKKRSEELQFLKYQFSNFQAFMKQASEIK